MRGILRFASTLGYGARAGLRNLSFALVLGSSAVSAETVTVAALGDSLTAGFGVLPGRGFVPQLETWLKAQGRDVKVINAGVSGDTTQGGLSRLEWTLTPEVDALIVNLGGNDILRGLDPALAKRNLETILTRAADQNLETMLIGLRAVRNYGPEYKAEFDAIYPDLAATYRPIFVPNFFAPLAPEGSSTIDSSLMQLDGIHPNGKGVKRIVEAIGPQVLELLDRVENGR